jgi:hypothetical protein
MLQVKLDRVEGSSMRQAADGLEADRIAHVTGLSGSAPDRLKQALGARGLPAVGQPHPTIANLYVHALSAEPNGPDAAVVTIRYVSRGAQAGSLPLVRIGSSLTQTTTDIDADGRRITVSYSPTGEESAERTQGMRVAIRSPQTTLQFTRSEQASPLAKARRFVGRINRTAVFDSGPGTWLCTAITGQSIDGGTTFEVTYAFQHDARSWQPTVSYIDPKTNRPPADLIDGVGSRTVRVYEEAEFKELGL